MVERRDKPCTDCYSVAGYRGTQDRAMHPSTYSGWIRPQGLLTGRQQFSIKQLQVKTIVLEIISCNKLKTKECFDLNDFSALRNLVQPPALGWWMWGYGWGGRGFSVGKGFEDLCNALLGLPGAICLDGLALYHSFFGSSAFRPIGQVFLSRLLDSLWCGHLAAMVTSEFGLQ